MFITIDAHIHYMPTFVSIPFAFLCLLYLYDILWRKSRAQAIYLPPVPTTLSPKYFDFDFKLHTTPAFRLSYCVTMAFHLVTHLVNMLVSVFNRPHFTHVGTDVL